MSSNTLTPVPYNGVFTSPVSKHTRNYANRAPATRGRARNGRGTGRGASRGGGRSASPRRRNEKDRNNVDVFGSQPIHTPNNQPGRYEPRQSHKAKPRTPFRFRPPPPRKPVLAPIFAHATFEAPPPLVPIQGQPGVFNALGPFPRPKEMKRSAADNGFAITNRFTDMYMRASPASPNDGPPYTPTPRGPRSPHPFVRSPRPASPMETDSDSDTGSERRVPRPPNPTPMAPAGEHDELMLDGNTPTPANPTGRRVSGGSSNDSLPSYASGVTDKIATILGEGLGVMAAILEGSADRQEEVLACCRRSVETTEEAERERTSYWKDALARCSNEDPAKARLAESIESCAKEMKLSNEKVVALAQSVMEHSVRLQVIADKQDTVTHRNKFLASVMQFEEEARRVMQPLRRELLSGQVSYRGGCTVNEHLARLYVEVGTSYIANWSLAWPRFTHTKPELYRNDTAEAIKGLPDAAASSVLEVVALLVDYTAECISEARGELPRDKDHGRLLGATWKALLPYLETHLAALVRQAGSLEEGEEKLTVASLRLRGALAGVLLQMDIAEYQIRDGLPLIIPALTPNAAAPLPIISTSSPAWFAPIFSSLPACFGTELQRMPYTDGSDWCNAALLAGLTVPVRFADVARLLENDKPNDHWAEVEGVWHSNLAKAGPFTAGRVIFVHWIWVRDMVRNTHARLVADYAGAMDLATRGMKGFGRILAVLETLASYMVEVMPTPLTSDEIADLGMVADEIYCGLDTLNRLLIPSERAIILQGIPVTHSNDVSTELPHIIPREHAMTPIASPVSGIADYKEMHAWEEETLQDPPELRLDPPTPPLIPDNGSPADDLPFECLPPIDTLFRAAEAGMEIANDRLTVRDPRITGMLHYPGEEEIVIGSGSEM